MRIEVGPTGEPVVGSVAECADVAAFAIGDFYGGAVVLAYAGGVGKVKRSFGGYDVGGDGGEECVRV